MTEPADSLSRLRHDLSNPLAAILAEVQLLLLAEDELDRPTIEGLRQIEALAGKMRAILQGSRNGNG